MTKTTKIENATTEVVALTESTQNLPAHMPQDIESIFNDLDGEPWRDLSSVYKTFEEGETVDAVVTGQAVKDLAGDGSENKVIEAMLRTGESVIFGDAVIVSSLWDKPKPMPVRIICTGKQKSSRGTYKTFKVLTW